MGLSCAGPLTHGYLFNKYTVGPQYPGFTIAGSATHGSKQYLQSMVGNLQVWRVDRILFSMPFYIKDLSLQGFWYLQGGPGSNTPRILKANCS